MHYNDSTEPADLQLNSALRKRTIYLIVNCCLMAMHSWVAVATTAYALKRRKKRSRLGGGRVIYSAAMAACLPNIRYLSTFSLIMITVRGATERTCEIVIDFGKVAMIVSMFCILSFFWVRQRAFYSHPSLGHSFGNCASILSVTSITLIIIMAVISVPLSVFPAEYDAYLAGAICGFKGGQKQYAFRNYFYASVTLTSQCLLLGLFIHPLRLHHQAQRHTNAERQIKTAANSRHNPLPNSSDTNRYVPRLVKLGQALKPDGIHGTDVRTGVNQKNRSNKQQRVYALIKRTMVLTGIASVTDLIAMAIIGFVISADDPQVVTRLVYDVDLSVNVFTVLLSLENWRRILWPFGRSYDVRRLANTQNGSTFASRSSLSNA